MHGSPRIDIASLQNEHRNGMTTSDHNDERFKYRHTDHSTERQDLEATGANTSETNRNTRKLHEKSDETMKRTTGDGAIK